MVRGGMGVALLPSEEFRSRKLDGIVELKLQQDIKKEVGIAWRRDATSPLVEATVKFAKEWSEFA
jgi:DNA-binding transcriptional LysR family regulator